MERAPYRCHGPWVIFVLKRKSYADDNLHGGLMTFVTGAYCGHGRTLNAVLNKIETVTDIDLVRVTRPAPTIAFQTETRMKKIRVLIIDEHPAVCRALAVRLESVPSVDVIGTVCDLDDGMARSRALCPDIILVEIKGKCDDVVRSLRAISCLVAQRQAGIIVLTSYLDEGEREGALEAGAARYLLKDIDTERLVAEIEAVAGETSTFAHSRAAKQDSSIRPLRR